MSYDPNRQYRCEIIRGKSQSQIHRLLPAYAKVIDEVCACRVNDFETLFNDAFAYYLPVTERTKKTFDNHRTEISGKLFGMYYFSDDGLVYKSQRTQKFLVDGDQKAFFKDICYKMQFPNGMQKTKPTVVQRIDDEICIRPNSFLIKFLTVAEQQGVEITQRIIAYYILNSLDVLQGKATPDEVLQVVRNDIEIDSIKTISAKDERGEEKAYSFKYQHIKEQLNYLELAGLIRVVDNGGDNRIVLNQNEQDAIAIFAAEWDKKPLFDVYSFDLGSIESRKNFQRAWDLYYSRLSQYAELFTNKENEV